LKNKKPPKNKTAASIPGAEIESLARCFLPFIREYFESEDGQREFAEWQKKRTGKKETKPDTPKS
jgi:hypothetical protein